MKRAEFKALMEIIDAKLDIYKARNSSDGGLIEVIRERELITEFEAEFCTEEDDDE